VNAQIPYNPMQLHSIQARVVDEQKHEQTSQRLVIEQLTSTPRQLVHSQSMAGLMSTVLVRAQNDLGLIEAPQTAPQAVQVARVTAQAGWTTAVQVGVMQEGRGNVVDGAKAAVGGQSVPAAEVGAAWGA